MTSTDLPSDADALLELAGTHGLELSRETLRAEEIGLDFRVVFARARDGQDWVLRIPRRADVLARAEIEGRLLRTVAPHLDVAVPDWRVHTEDLIAYPLLPGTPGLTLDAAGEVSWNVDVSSPDYARSLGATVAQLHGIGIEEAAATGIDVLSPAQVRARWRTDLERVAESFEIAPPLWERWNAWVEEDSYWPRRSVLTHGEIYPGHTLVADGRLSAVLDWTTAAVGDPAKDLMFQRVGATEDAFELFLEHYEAGGGQLWPRLADHCTEMFSASPVAYGLFALETGLAAHWEAAASSLNPTSEA
ncbi:macrolide 2'-phosphotransferase [Brachybacterium sp. YJGR34]|uniref:macrolide 2'-phosphotransferase n=1 Tax=Brachybacterium sp. YJGR34 TaxID=2059911 RepID=UPI000E0B136A|nr:macrolide 2'-phosphotransferase [Brachybacterium sp. YJGR34]